MTVSKITPHKTEECAFFFKRPKDLSFAVSVIYKSRLYLKAESSLYMLGNACCLVLKGIEVKDKFYFLNEFADSSLYEKTDCEYIKEYGVLMLSHNAVKKYNSIYSE